MEEERLHTINLRKEFNKVASYKRSKKAIIALKEYISQHMKVPIKGIKIGKELNLKIWEHGRKNPPAKIKVKSMVKDSKAYVELPGVKFEEAPVKEEKKTETIKEKLTQKLETKEKPKEDLKALEKEEIKEEKREHKKSGKLSHDIKDIKGKGKLKIEEHPIPESGKKGGHDTKR